MPLRNIKKGTGKKHSAVAFAGCVQAQAGTVSCVRRLVGQGELRRVAKLERSEKNIAANNRMSSLFIFIYLFQTKTQNLGVIYMGKGSRKQF